MRKAAEIVLLNEERAQLLQLARSQTVSVRVARRAQIVLGAADGLDIRTIAAQVGVGRVQVGRWRNRYIEGGLAAIERDLPRGGRPVKVDAAKIVRLTTQTLPANATQWSTFSPWVAGSVTRKLMIFGLRFLATGLVALYGFSDPLRRRSYSRSTRLTSRPPDGRSLDAHRKSGHVREPTQWLDGLSKAVVCPAARPRTMSC